MRKREGEKVRELPNILLIAVDTLRAKSLTCYGYSGQVVGPNIAKIARGGIRFENAFTTTNRTDPAFTSLFSGLYPIRHGVVAHGNHVNRGHLARLGNLTFLAELLRDLDYTTYAIDWLGRWHRRGFSFYSGSLKFRHKTEPNVIHSTRLLRALQVLDVLSAKAVGRDGFTNLYHYLTHERFLYDRASQCTDEALKRLDGHSSKKGPFFMYIHYWDPHHPYFTPPTITATLSQLPEQRYINEINYVDEHIGRIYGFLEDKGLLDDTFIILLGDHGENIRDHGYYLNHKGLYEDTIHVPLIFSYKPLGKGKTVRALVQHVDIFPTIVALLQAKPPQRFDGYNLLPLVHGSVDAVRKFVYCEDFSPGGQDRSPTRRRCIRTHTWKYIQTFRSRKEDIFSLSYDPPRHEVKEEVYHLATDPGEAINLADQHPPELSDLSSTLKVFVNDLRMLGVPERQREEHTECDTAETSEISSRLRGLGYL